MKKNILILSVVILAGLAFWFYNKSRQNSASNADSNQQQTNILMQITSSAFLDQQTIPTKYTCDGEGVNPPLEFKGIPPLAKTLALIVDDPDAPAGTWTHWTVWNITPDLNQIGENSVSAGAVQGKTSSGQQIYGGPCPPSGTHRYFFKLYALDVKLALPSYSTVDKLESAMQGHIVDKAQLVGLYSR